MATTEVVSDTLIVRWAPDLDSLVIEHPDRSRFSQALVRISSSTLAEMSFAQASSFIGERIALLVPQLRTRYVDPSTGLVRGVDQA